MNAPPLTITGPAALVEAVPYLLGFTPTESLVIVGLAAKTVTVTVRADLDGLTPDQITELAHTLRDKADATAKIALTYGSTADPEPVAAAARAAGLQLAEHLRVAEGRYWSLTCPIEGCCLPEGRPIPQAGAVAAEFVLAGKGSTHGYRRGCGRSGRVPLPCAAGLRGRRRPPSARTRPRRGSERTSPMRQSTRITSTTRKKSRSWATSANHACNYPLRGTQFGRSP